MKQIYGLSQRVNEVIEWRTAYIFIILATLIWTLIVSVVTVGACLLIQGGLTGMFDILCLAIGYGGVVAGIFGSIFYLYHRY